MDFGEIFKDALHYPISDYKKLLILGILFLVINLPSIITGFGINIGVLLLLMVIVSILLMLLVYGFGVSVIRNSIDLNNEIPDFDWANNFTDGGKFVIINFIYFIIPSIIIAVVAFISGFGPISTIFSSRNMDKFAQLNAGSTTADMYSIVPQEVWNSLLIAIFITVIVAIVLFIIFYIFDAVAVCRFAKHDSLDEGLNFREVFDDAKQIGIIRINQRHSKTCLNKPVIPKIV